MAEPLSTEECSHALLLANGRTIQLSADECARCERTKRLQAEHERDVLVEKLAQFGKALKDSVADDVSGSTEGSSKGVTGQ